MRGLLLVIILSAACYAQLGQEARFRRMSPAEQVGFLERLDTALTKWEKAASVVDAAKLDVGYEEGHLIEQRRDMLLKQISTLRESVRLYHAGLSRSKPAVSLAMELTIVRLLSGIGADAGDMASVVISPIVQPVPTDKVMAMRKDWADGLVEVEQEEINLDNTYYTHLYEGVSAADDALKSCNAPR